MGLPHIVLLHHNCIGSFEVSRRKSWSQRGGTINVAWKREEITEKGRRSSQLHSQFRGEICNAIYNSLLYCVHGTLLSANLIYSTWKCKPCAFIGSLPTAVLIYLCWLNGMALSQCVHAWVFVSVWYNMPMVALQLQTKLKKLQEEVDQLKDHCQNVNAELQDTKV